MFGLGGGGSPGISGAAVASGGAAPTDTIRLEGFSESLRGRRAWVVGTSVSLRGFLTSLVYGLDQEVSHRGRKMLILYGASTVVPRWLHLLGWDIVIRVRETIDLRLAMTVMQNEVKPVRIVWWGDEPPASVLGPIADAKDVSFLGAGPVAPKGGAGAAAGYDAVFWAPDIPFPDVERGVQARAAQAFPNLRAVHKELQSSEIALVWSSIGESDKRGALYWVDPKEGVESVGTGLDAQETAEVLRGLADSIAGGKR